VRARLLDISRLISRMGQGPLTGIDRVELAYFREFLSRLSPVWFLCRTPRSYALLDRKGGQAVLDRITGAKPWGGRGMARLLAPSLGADRQRAIADVWRLARFRVPARRGADWLAEVFADGVEYFNVGHSNLKPEILKTISTIPQSRIVIFIHDIIPITLPEYCRTEVIARFRADMENVTKFADRVIFNSSATQQEAERFFLTCGRVPPSLVAHLGLDLSIASNPDRFAAASPEPRFHVIGTIEPRKNHALLLDIWQDFCRAMPPEDVPELHIIGRRGWNNSDVFRVLDRDPMINRAVFEHNSLSDAAVRAHIAQSWGLLFPSHTEGFGLPLIEAAAFGVPIFCGENAIYHEILGDYPLYLSLSDPYPWQQGILGRAGRKRESEADRRMRAETVKLPDWKTHFDRIFRFV